MFSSALAKTLPFASQAMQVGGVVGSAKMMGPVTSVGTSAVTQLSSSSAVVLVRFGCVVMRALDEGSSSSCWVLVCLRFLDFLSPLKASGLTMAAVILGLLDCRQYSRYCVND